MCWRVCAPDEGHAAARASALRALGGGGFRAAASAGAKDRVDWGHAGSVVLPQAVRRTVGVAQRRGGGGGVKVPGARCAAGGRGGTGGTAGRGQGQQATAAEAEL